MCQICQCPHPRVAVSPFPRIQKKISTSSYSQPCFNVKKLYLLILFLLNVLLDICDFLLLFFFCYFNHRKYSQDNENDEIDTLSTHSLAKKKKSFKRNGKKIYHHFFQLPHFMKIIVRIKKKMKQIIDKIIQKKKYT
jgi:hypothetical protein